MNVSCPDCQSVFRVDPARVTSSNLRARCAVCGGLIAVGASIRWADEFPSATVAARANAGGTAGTASTGGISSTGGSQSLGTSTSAFVSHTAQPAADQISPSKGDDRARPAGDVTPPAAFSPAEPSSLGAAGGDSLAFPAIDAPATRTPAFAPPRRSSPPTPAFGAPAFPASSLRPPTPAFTPSAPTTPPVAAPPSAPLAPSAPTAPAASSTPKVTPKFEESFFAATPQPMSQPMSQPTSRENSPPFVAPIATPQSHSFPSSESGASAVATPRVPTAPQSGVATPARRPLNPFLSNDPNQKARRLARALVSDMVAYHPEKQDEGNRNGTLKQLFRDEIKKSYEEYVEQVGRDFAESTTHFQDALNDVLAAGKRIF